ncbi:hypothetical protein [Morganella morganii]|uniref:hypothetical protein n=1 Tax=Morganella morganii TaxID=582 RepID=UPI00141A26E9|nr:hypothetical protein [Morganella morganii]ELB1288928.1 hypothetical protein [Morganella morganii]NIH19592.1 hypothetical protein [Morganella morganii]
MKISTQRALCFFIGVAVSCIFFYAKKGSEQKEIEISKGACFFVWETHGQPTILTYGNYYDGQYPECRVFDNGRFRGMNDRELISYQASWETNIGYSE